MTDANVDCNSHLKSVTLFQQRFYVNLGLGFAGSSVAGLPLSLLLQKSGWGAMFTFLIASCGVVVALLLPMINARSHSQMHAADA